MNGNILGYGRNPMAGKKIPLIMAAITTYLSVFLELFYVGFFQRDTATSFVTYMDLLLVSGSLDKLRFFYIIAVIFIFSLDSVLYRLKGEQMLDQTVKLYPEESESEV